VHRYQTNPARHEVFTAEEEIGDVEHLFWDVERADRVRSVAKAVERHGRTIVFCRTRHGADRFAHQLGALGVNAVALHGNRTQGQRDRAIAAFSNGKAEVLVATDVAARGIHVDGVNCVVHLDPPATDKDYVHRSGRTGRAGAKGTVISIVANDQRAAVRVLQRQLGLGDGGGGGSAPTLAPAAQPQRARPSRPQARPQQRPGRAGGGHRRRSASR
jgi:superfamily II DNA/RNA helicase